MGITQRKATPAESKAFMAFCRHLYPHLLAYKYWFIAGGYPAYLIGKTTTYTDIDVFVNGYTNDMSYCEFYGCPSNYKRLCDIPDSSEDSASASSGVTNNEDNVKSGEKNTGASENNVKSGTDLPKSDDNVSSSTDLLHTEDNKGICKTLAELEDFKKNNPFVRIVGKDPAVKVTNEKSKRCNGCEIPREMLAKLLNLQHKKVNTCSDLPDSKEDNTSIEKIRLIKDEIFNFVYKNFEAVDVLDFYAKIIEDFDMKICRVGIFLNRIDKKVYIIQSDKPDKPNVQQYRLDKYQARIKK